MRVVPVDRQSFSELPGSRFGALSTGLLMLHGVEGLKKWFEFISRFRYKRGWKRFAQCLRYCGRPPQLSRPALLQLS